MKVERHSCRHTDASDMNIALHLFLDQIIERTHLPRMQVPEEFLRGPLGDLRGKVPRQDHEIRHSLTIAQSANL